MSRVRGLLFCIFFCIIRPRPLSTLFPYTTLFRSVGVVEPVRPVELGIPPDQLVHEGERDLGVTSLVRSEEHTSELQSHHDLVCRLLLEKKKQTATTRP